MLVALHRTSLASLLVLSASFLLGFSGRVQAKSVVSVSNNAVIPSHKRTFLPRDRDGNLMMLVRGGSNKSIGSKSGAVAKTKITTKEEQEAAAVAALRERRKQQLRWSSVGAGMVAVVVLYYRNRTVVNKLFDKEAMRNAVLSLLQRVDPESTKGLVLYILGLTVWETFGMSTIPVESAAGMAFGFWRCVLASTAGKLMGVAISFLLGRSLMKDWVRRQLQGNKIMDLLDETVQVGPLRVATMVRYSFLPEFAVNYGCAILEPIRLWMILLATVVHGVPFSCLWAWIGVDTALQLQNNDDVVLPNRTLQVTVVVAGIVGFLLTPLLMTWWLRALHLEAQNNKKSNGNNKKSNGNNKNSNGNNKRKHTR